MNNGTSTLFTTHTNYTAGFSGACYYLAIGDFNGDGHKDIVVSGYDADEVFVLMNNGNGTFQSPVGYSIGGKGGYITTGDLEHNGRDDIVVSYATGSQIGVLLSNPDGTFQSTVSYTVPGGSPGDLGLADFGNGNVDVDVLVTNTTKQDVFLGNGDGTLQTAFTVSAAYDPQQLAIADVNGDGLPDLITTAGLDPGSMSVLLNSTLLITTKSLSNWDANLAGYSQTVNTLNGSGAITLNVYSGDSLPAGLSLNSSTGVISETPTQTGTYTFRITATDSSGDAATESYTITINPAPSITTNTLSDWDQNLAGYDQTVNATGGTGSLTFGLQSGGSLPNGLSLNSATGAITGTPTVIGAFTFHIVVTDSLSDSATEAYTVNINAPPAIVTTSLDDWDQNLAGYNQSVSTSGGTGTFTFSLQSGDSLPAGLSLSTSGVITGTPTAAGTTTFHVIASDSLGDQATQAYTVVINAPLTITTTTLADWDQNLAGYNQTVKTSGGTGTLTFGLQSGDSLPNGLSLNSASGVITGTPTTIGGATFHIVVADGVGAMATQGYTVHINADPAITTTSLEDWDQNFSGYDQTVAVSGGTGALTFSVHAGNNLPAGLSLNTSTGVITGIPTTVGATTFEIDVVDSLGERPASRTRSRFMLRRAFPQQRCPDGT